MFVKTEEEYDNLKLYTVFSYNCKQCGKELTAKKYDTHKKQARQRLLLCKKCKTEKSNLEKYGVKNPSQLEEVKRKREQTNLEKFGVVNPFQSEEIKEKIKEVLMERYGVEHPAQSLLVQERMKKTCLERYGVSNVNKLEEIQRKKEDLFFKKYGCKNPMQTKEVKEKLERSFLETYGVRSPFQIPEVRKKISEFRKEYWKTLSDEERLELRRKCNKRYKYKSKDDETFDSEWELKFYEYCKSNGYKIEREPVELTFEFNGEIHHYYPDFKVDSQLIEIKGNHFLKNGKWICPFNRARDDLFEAKHQCAIENGVKILYKEDLLEILN